MKDLLNQDRALSPALVRTGITLLGLLLAIVGVFVLLGALGNLFSGRPLAALIQISGGAAILVFAFLVARLLSEILMALHRLNDRLTLLGDEARAARASAPEPAAKPKRAPRKSAKPAAPKSDADA